MSRTVIVADASLSHFWEKALSREGHEVVCVNDGFSFQHLFEGVPFDIAIVNIERPDWGETMLIPQVHAAWPDCKVIAVVSNYQFRGSAVFEMGLWTPDQVLIKPLATRLLCTTVSFLWAQARSREIRQLVSGSFVGDNPIPPYQIAKADDDAADDPTPDRAWVGADDARTSGA